MKIQITDKALAHMEWRHTTQGRPLSVTDATNFLCLAQVENEYAPRHNFFPTQGTMSLTAPTDNVIIAAKTMIKALKQPSQILENKISKNQMTALDNISQIFSNSTLLTNKELPIATEKRIPTPQPVITQPLQHATTNPPKNPHQIPFNEEKIS